MTTAIDAFWKRWPALREALNQAIEAKDYGDLPQTISELVAAIDSNLEWELGPGQRAQHAFTVTAAGNLALRHLAERWLRGAPAGDEVWEFHDARQPRRGWSLHYAGAELSPDECRLQLSTDLDVERIDIRLFHPAFASLDADQRIGATFLLLDGYLGEDGTSRWIGGIETATESPGSATLEALGNAVNELRASATGVRWAVMTTDQFVLRVNRAAKHIDHPAKTARCDVVVQADRGDQLEAELFGRETPMLHIGSVTRGSERQVVLYAAESSSATAMVEEVARAFGARGAWSLDPSWTRVRALQRGDVD